MDNMNPAHKAKKDVLLNLKKAMMEMMAEDMDSGEGKPEGVMAEVKMKKVNDLPEGMEDLVEGPEMELGEESEDEMEGEEDLDSIEAKIRELEEKKRKLLKA